jgi:hypothetical protein
VVVQELAQTVGEIGVFCQEGGPVRRAVGVAAGQIVGDRLVNLLLAVGGHERHPSGSRRVSRSAFKPLLSSPATAAGVLPRAAATVGTGSLWK